MHTKLHNSVLSLSKLLGNIYSLLRLLEKYQTPYYIFH